MQLTLAVIEYNMSQKPAVCVLPSISFTSKGCLFTSAAFCLSYKLSLLLISIVFLNYRSLPVYLFNMGSKVVQWNSSKQGQCGTLWKFTGANQKF